MKVLVGVLVVLLGALSVANIAMAQETEKARSPLLLALGSFVVPGLGQLLQNEEEKAAIHFGVALLIPIAGTIASWVSPVPDIVLMGTGVASFSWAFLSSIDAYRIAKDFNKTLGFN